MKDLTKLFYLFVVRNKVGGVPFISLIVEICIMLCHVRVRLKIYIKSNPKYRYFQLKNIFITATSNCYPLYYEYYHYFQFIYLFILYPYTGLNWQFM